MKLLSLTLFMVFPVMIFAQEQEVMDNFEQLLPRGAIAAIDNPTFVPADQAHIRPDAWVLGFHRDGQARAYSLTLLNSHEVVNDRMGESLFAAVW